MCGIIGYQGKKSPKDVVLAGLKTLEYRGYDSAGVAIFDQGKIKRFRAEGKLINLSTKIANEKFDGGLGIGHTRWATHGPPNERNAHPHFVDGIALVHNGIIENYLQLKEELKKENIIPDSDTDTEIVAHLVSIAYKKLGDFKKAVLSVVPRLRGAYSILVINEQSFGEMIAFKNGPPLIFGVNSKDGETMVASDVQAMVGYCDKVYHLNDNEIVVVKGKDFQLLDTAGKEMSIAMTDLVWNKEVAEKLGYPHFMAKEIFEQPRAFSQAIEAHIDKTKMKTALALLVDQQNIKDANQATELLKNIDRIFIIACGTSYYAAMVGEYLIERLCQVPVEIDIASEFRYRYPVIPKNSLCMFISQSGETADTLAAIRLAKERGATTLSICNVKGSTIDRESNLKLYMNGGPEIGVASTKALTCTLGVLNVFAIWLAQLKAKLPTEVESKMVLDLLTCPSQMESVLVHDKFFAKAAVDLKKFKGFLYIGRGVSFPIALEGALKLKELAYLHAEGYAAGEMKHGPLALIDKDMAIVALVPQDELIEKTISNLEETKARGGQAIVIGSGENAALKNMALHYLSIPEAPWNVNPVLEVIPLQLLAYHVALVLGHDVDQPRNLAKSVTVE
jgi:glucosamine--fructose-6-phosphate aminotransferase (isomerizing)